MQVNCSISIIYQNLGAFRKLRSLLSLSIRQTHITVLKKGTFEGLVSLKSLSMSDGRLKTIEDGKNTRVFPYYGVPSTDCD